MSRNKVLLIVCLAMIMSVSHTPVHADPHCLCDLNIDARCDMRDWLLFGQDWGRTDCPIP